MRRPRLTRPTLRGQQSTANSSSRPFPSRRKLLRGVALATFGAVAAAAAGGCPRSLVAAPVSGLSSLLGYVTQFNTNSVNVVDVVRKSPVGSPIAVGQGPVRAILSPGGSQDYLYVADKTSGTISFVNRRTKSDEKDVFAGSDPVDLTFQTINDSNPSNQQWLFVANKSPQTVTRINVATQNQDVSWDYKLHQSAPVATCASTNTSTPPQAMANFTPTAIAADTAADAIYVVSSTVLQPQFNGQACSGTGTFGVVSVLTNSASGFKETSSFTLPGAIQPSHALFDPTLKRLYISDRGAAQVFMVMNPSSSQPQVIPITNGLAGPTSDLAISTDGTTLYATEPTSNAFAQINTGTRTAQSFDPGGTQPDPLSISNDGSFLWIGNVGSSTISYVNLASCKSQGAPCSSQGSVQYSTDTTTSQPPGDIILAPGIGS